MKKIFFALIFLASAACSAAVSPRTPSKSPDAGFCGRSTQGVCQKDGDCVAGGCSGQVCQSKKEEGSISTCEYRECYNAASFGLTCGCVNQTCRWH